MLGAEYDSPKEQLTVQVEASEWLSVTFVSVFDYASRCQD